MPALSYPPEQLSEHWHDSTITYRDIAKCSRLTGIISVMDKKYGFQNWGEDEVANYLIESRNNKLLAGRGKVGKVDKAGKIVKERKPAPIPEEDRTLAQRINSLMSHYEPESITANDAQTFRNMAVIEMQMGRIDELLQDEEDVSQLKILSETYAKLSGEYRQLQSTLGIDRNSRDTQVDTANELKRMIAGAKELLEKHSVPIVCPKCLESEAEIKINQGFIVFHFRQNVPWRWESVCPRCGEKMVMVNGELVGLEEA